MALDWDVLAEKRKAIEIQTVPCSLTNCDNSRTTPVRILGNWEYVCNEHAIGHWAVGDSLAHAYDTLAGRRA